MPLGGSNDGPPLDDEDEAERAAEQDAVDGLKDLPDAEVLKRARKALLARLLAKAELGTITAPQMATLRNLLRDNGMVMITPGSLDDVPQQRTPATLPEMPSTDYEG